MRNASLGDHPQVFKTSRYGFSPDLIRACSAFAFLLRYIVIGDLPKGEPRSGLGGGEASPRNLCLIPNTCVNRMPFCPPQSGWAHLSTFRLESLTQECRSEDETDS